VALPLVWAFQYAGGGRPQWGGRYVLVSGVVLAVVAAAALASAPRVARIVLGALALGVTLTGIAYLSQRSHVLADGMGELRETPADVLISQEAHVLREGGAFYSPDQHWLTAVGEREVREAFRVAERSGADTVALVGSPGRDRPATIAGYERGDASELELLPRFKIRITTYERSES
jgi:hypothetical protein